MNDCQNIQATSRIVASYLDTGEVVADFTNAVHPQNMARIIARGLARETNGWIHKMAFGNGGTHINSGLTITYLTPNTVGTAASLYNQTYEEIIDDSNVSVGSGNSCISSASPDPAITSVVTCTCVIAANEPSGQANSDGTTTDPDSLYTFDELGLFTADAQPLMLTHAIFSPIENTGTRAMLINYTLTISVN